MQVNRWKDFLERVAWTAIQAAAAATLTALALDDVTWQEGITFVGIATLAAACKVTVAQQVGDRGSGDAFPGGVEKG